MDEDEERAPTACEKIKSMTKKKEAVMVWMTLVGVVSGIVIGFTLQHMKLSEEALHWISVPGTIFLRLLNMAVLPLIGAKIVVVAATLDHRKNGKIGALSLVYIICANFLCAIIGVSLALLIKPGYAREERSFSTSMPSLAAIETVEIFRDLIYNVFPDNLLGNLLYKTKTSLENSTIPGKTVKLHRQDGSNMIGLLFCTILIGTAARFAKHSALFVEVFHSTGHVIMVVVKWILWLTPLGVCSLITASVAAVEDMGKTFVPVALFLATFLTSMAVHFVILATLLFSVTKKNPLIFLQKNLKVYMVCLATASPVVAIPEMYTACDRAGVARTVSRFVIPFAVSTKLETGVAFAAAGAVFAAQYNDVTLDMSSSVLIVVILGVSAMAQPQVSHISLLMLNTVLVSMDIPAEKAISLLFAVEWFTDRVRSASMGISHCYCAAFIDTLCKKSLSEAEGPEATTASIHFISNDNGAVVDSVQDETTISIQQSCNHQDVENNNINDK